MLLQPALLYKNKRIRLSNIIRLGKIGLLQSYKSGIMTKIRLVGYSTKIYNL